MLIKLASSITLVAVVYGFGTMEEKGTYLCIVKKAQLSKRGSAWAVGLGYCKDGVPFEYKMQGGQLATADGLCLGTWLNSHMYATNPSRVFAKQQRL